MGSHFYASPSPIYYHCGLDSLKNIKRHGFHGFKLIKSVKSVAFYFFRGVSFTVGVQLGALMGGGNYET
jgi:hypothetical protein